MHMHSHSRVYVGNKYVVVVGGDGGGGYHKCLLPSHGHGLWFFRFPLLFCSRLEWRELCIDYDLDKILVLYLK